MKGAQKGSQRHKFAKYCPLYPQEVFTSLIKGCAVLDSDHQRAWQTYEHMKVWHCQPDNVLLTLMIHICARTGEAEKAMLLFKEIEIMGHRPTEVSYASIIYALSRRPDYYKEVFNYLEKMKDEGFIPTIEVMTNVLNAAAKSGDIDTAELYAMLLSFIIVISFVLFLGMQQGVR
jgi:pentatricopeptide repeat protein